MPARHRCEGVSGDGRVGSGHELPVGVAAVHEHEVDRALFLDKLAALLWVLCKEKAN